MKNEGVVRGNDYDAFRASLKLHTQVTDWLEVGAQVNFQNRSDGDMQVSLGSNYWDANMLRNSPYAGMYTEDGSYNQYPMTGFAANGAVTTTSSTISTTTSTAVTPVLNSIFNVKVNLPLDSPISSTSPRACSGTTTTTTCRPTSPSIARRPRC